METVVLLIIATCLYSVKAAPIPSIADDLDNKVEELVNRQRSILNNMKTMRFGDPGYTNGYTNNNVPQNQDAYARSQQPDITFPQIFAAYYDELFTYNNAMICFKNYETKMDRTPNYFDDFVKIQLVITEVQHRITRYLEQELEHDLIAGSEGHPVACRFYNEQANDFMMVATMDNFADYLSVLRDDVIRLRFTGSQ